MKTYTKLFILIVFLFIAKPSFAMLCKFDAIPAGFQEQILEPLYIPPELPAGSVVWRSKEHSVTITCWHNTRAEADYAVLYIASSDPDRAQLQNELDIGFYQNGRDQLCTPGGGTCRFNTWMTIPQCNNYNGCPNETRSVSMTFGVFLAKKSASQTGKTGPVLSNPPPLYALAQFRGGREANDINNQGNAGIWLYGLDELTYIGCASTVDISPRLIQFGRVSTFNAQAGTTIKERPITLTAKKSCSYPYGLAATLSPNEGTLTNSRNTLIPQDNNSVGIQLIDSSTNQKLEFNKEFFIAPKNNRNQTVQKNLTARLIWMKNNPSLGAFHASAILDVYYK